MEDDISNNMVVINEHQVFVNLLSKYKVLLGNDKATYKKKVETAKELANKYKQESGKEITVDGVFKKICNLKSRVKEKNYKNLTRSKKLYYTEWEKDFMDIWVGDNITVLPKKLKLKSSDAASQAESSTSDNVVRTENSCCESSRPDSNTSNNFTMKIEPDDYELQDSSCQISTSVPIWETDFKSEMESEPDKDKKYNNLTLDQLKRVALIAQIESFQAEKSAALAKQKLALYKLSVLQTKNRNR